MPRKKMPECCVCGFDAHDAYEVDGNVYCEDCLWEELTEADINIYAETTTTYTVNGFHIKEDINQAIKEACDYLDIAYKKIH